MIQDDAKLGQLALARGLVDFKTLLECIKETGSGDRTFEDVLIARGHLSHNQVEDLKATLENNPSKSLQEIQAGQTLVLDHIKSTTNNGKLLPEDTEVDHFQLSLQQTLIHLDDSDLIPVTPSGSYKSTPPPFKRAHQERYALRRLIGHHQRIGIPKN